MDEEMIRPEWQREHQQPSVADEVVCKQGNPCLAHSRQSDNMQNAHPACMRIQRGLMKAF